MQVYTKWHELTTVQKDNCLDGMGVVKPLWPSEDWCYFFRGDEYLACLCLSHRENDDVIKVTRGTLPSNYINFYPRLIEKIRQDTHPKRMRLEIPIIAKEPAHERIEYVNALIDIGFRIRSMQTGCNPREIELQMSVQIN